MAHRTSEGRLDRREGGRGLRAPTVCSKGQTKHTFVMSRDPLKIRLVFRLERLAMVPRVFDGRQRPEVAFRIQYNPVTIGSVHEECRHLLSNNQHPLLIVNRFGHGIPFGHEMRFVHGRFQRDCRSDQMMRLRVNVQFVPPGSGGAAAPDWAWVSK